MGQCLDAGHLVSPASSIVRLSKYLTCFDNVDSQNAGQNCIGIERLIVHSSQYEEVYALIVERVRGLRLGSALSAEGVGSGVDCGAMISTARFQELEDVIDDARNHGARVEHGGTRMRHPYLEHGAYFTPTVVGDVVNDMNIAQRERKCFFDRWSLVNSDGVCRQCSHPSLQ